MPIVITRSVNVEVDEISPVHQLIVGCFTTFTAGGKAQFTASFCFFFARQRQPVTTASAPHNRCEIPDVV